MAANNAPKNDFAPAWLKIPAQENPKPSASKNSDHMNEKPNRPRRDDSYHNSYNRYGPDYARQLHRQHSFDNYFENSKRYPPGQSKYHHHSVDDEFYAYPYGPYSYYNGYGGYDKFGMHYSSQPSLFRPPGREGKYQHPNTRFGQLNGGYPGYYDLYPYDYYPGDPYYSGYPTHGNKRSYYHKDGRSSMRESKDKDGEKSKDKDGEREKPFSDDFPSLNGTGEGKESATSKPSGSGSVWDNPLLGKSGSKENGFEILHRDTSKNQDGANTIYKSLVPKTSVVRKGSREGLKLNGNFKEILATGKPPTPPGSQREGCLQSPTPPLDILNTRFVTQPKNVSNKSDFLKALRKDKLSKNVENGFDSHQESDSRHQNNGSFDPNLSGGDQLVNGMDDLGMEEPNENILSSSLEAEQRLLREMGWNEQDEEEYVITEDDMKEFQKLTDMVKKQPRNGLVRSLPKTWSPKHIPIYQPNVNELNETVSSSDSEDDSC